MNKKMYKNHKMLSKNFFTSNGLFIYSRYVFQVRNLYTHDQTDKVVTMLKTSIHKRKNDLQKPASSENSTFVPLKINLQSRLSRIRKNQTREPSDTTDLKKLRQIVSKENEENLQSPLLFISKNIEKELVSSTTNNPVGLFSLTHDQVIASSELQSTISLMTKNNGTQWVSSIYNSIKTSSFPCIQQKSSIQERISIRNMLLKRKNNNAEIEAIEIFFNDVKLECLSDKVLKDNVSLKPNKEIFDCTVNQKIEPCSIKEVTKNDLNLNVINKLNEVVSNVTLSQKRESIHKSRILNLKKEFIPKVDMKVTPESPLTSNITVGSTNFIQNIKPVEFLIQGSKDTIEDGHFLNNFFVTSTVGELSNVEEVLEDTQVKMKSTTNDLANDDVLSEDLTSVLCDFNLDLTEDLTYIENKMKNLTISDQENDEVNAIVQKYKPMLSYHRRLDNLKLLIGSEHGTNTLSKNNRMQCLPIDSGKLLSDNKLGRKILTARRSYKTSSSFNDSDQQFEPHQGNKTSDKEVTLFNKELLPANNLPSPPNISENKSHEKVNTNTKKVPLECKHIKVQGYNEIRHLHDKFPFPKNNLHNYYQILSEQLKDKSLTIEPHYKSVKMNKAQQEWDCMYHLKWPENCKISAQALTKKRASTLAALRCLAFLTEQGKLSQDGLPLIYSKEEVKKITQKKETELKFDDNTINKMITIVDIFKNNINPFTKEVNYNNYDDQKNKIFDEEGNSVNFFLAKNPVYLGMHQYWAKEKVELPISNYKDYFIELLQKNKCVIVKGEPGCGKSSRIPQYVLESWIKEASQDQLCRIAVTQPRRIAAISLAERVASERDEELGHIVGYQVRLQSNFQTRTGRILYCTTGILLRHLQNDPNLTKFSHVILDEAHERDVNTDLLMNLLKTAQKENDNLKVVVMSATIDADAFSAYFEGAPVLDVPGFTYPVTKHFLDGCQLNVSKTLKMCNGDSPNVVHQDVVEILGYIHKNKPEGAILTFLPGWEDLIQVQKLIRPQGDVVVYLVHSKLKDSEQHKIFSRPPPGVRKIILATNIAETSITIDDVVYVVDTGIHKDQIFDNNKGINVLDLEWISKASANQRAGRAGRCSPGESFHLYTKERFSNFPDYSTPKILNSSLTKVILDSKMFTNNMDACDFMNSLITPPEKFAVERAVDELKQLELLDENEKLTPLGATLVNFQLEPSLAKAMVNGVVFKCTIPIVDIVTLFSSDTGIFGSLSLTDKDNIKNVKSKFSKTSDHLALMRLYENWLELIEEEDEMTAHRFCRDTNLVPYKLEFVKKLKDIHLGYLYNGLNTSMPISDDYSNNNELVKAVLYSGTGTVLQHRHWDMVKNRLKTNVNVLVTRNNHKATISSESVNYKRHKFPSDFLVYINETRSNIRRTTIVRECSLIPAISVLLFSNKKLEVLEADSSDDLSDNLVKIGIKNTKLQFLCDKVQADILMGCKQAIEESYKYLIHQLTNAGEDIPEFLENWDNILKHLCDILEKSKVE